MRALLSTFAMLSLLALSSPPVEGMNGQHPDTASVNELTRKAYIEARTQPGKSIKNAHKALSEASKLQYDKGIADACLALGMAYLARYNAGDSALYYNNKALEIYRRDDDPAGIARAAYGLAYVFSFKGDMLKSGQYSRMSLEYFEKTGDKRGVLNALSTLTYAARHENDYEKAIDLTKRAIKTARSVNDTIPLADAMNTLGNIYKDMLLFDDAIDSYYGALELWQAKNDSSGMAIAYGSIGLMYYYQKDYRNALRHNFMKLPISEQTGNLWETSKTLNNIAQIYSALEIHDSSLFYLRKGLLLTETMNYPSGMANVCHNIASSHLQKGNTDSALYYIERSVDIARELNDPELSTYLVTMGRVQSGLGDYASALANGREAYRMAGEQNEPIKIAAAAALLSDLYSYTGRKDLAFDYLKEHYTISDSINNNEFLKKITRLELQNEYDRKQEEAAFRQKRELMIRENRIQRQNLYLKGLVLLILLVIALSVIILHNTRLRARYARTRLEQKLLRAQMNPHFIFNSLSAVQDLIMSGHPEKANTYLAKIANLMRNILENSLEEFIPLEKEIETLRLYLDIQKLRFDREFDYEFSIDRLIDADNIAVPPMLAQPCLENSVEHGLKHNKDKGRVDISYKLEKGLLKLEVVDNGVGRKESSAIAGSNGRDRRSISTELIKKRLGHFRKTTKKKNISYNIEDLYKDNNAAGTRVVIMMPVRKMFA